MSTSLTVPVRLAERSYDILIGTGALAEVGPAVCAKQTVTHAVVITDANIETTHATRVVESLAVQDIRVDMLVVEPGESTKSIDMCDELWQQMLRCSADRKTIVVAVGGGVVGDLAGFIAASFARGLAFVQVPTTLLAQVDSSVGGKVGVNLPKAKNMVGAFWQPIVVYIDTAVLSTLDDRQYRAGLAEVVKYGVILDADFFAYLEANIAAINTRDPEVLRRIIARSCELKAQVVAADEREETGQRAVLNYGHTFCHAIEAASGYGELLHGEGVAIGMICASRLAERLEMIDAKSTQRQIDLLTALHLPVTVPKLDHQQLLDLMMHDKKVEHGRLRFILPDRIGHVELVGDVDLEHVRAVLAACS
jgi:3-dehydroquinate synthase